MFDLTDPERDDEREDAIDWLGCAGRGVLLLLTIGFWYLILFRIWL